MSNTRNEKSPSPEGRQLGRIEDSLEFFRQIQIEGKDKNSIINEFELVLDSVQLDSDSVYRHYRKLRNSMFVFFLSGLLLISLALAIIFIPLPKSLEVKTLYYFNPDDGITVSDIIALIILFAGIYLTLAGSAARKKIRG